MTDVGNALHMISMMDKALYNKDKQLQEELATLRMQVKAYKYMCSKFAEMAADVNRLSSMTFEQLIEESESDS